MPMIYKTLGKNHTGQILVACPHRQNGFTDFWVDPDGRPWLRVQYFSGGYMTVSLKTIVMWCEECYDLSRDSGKQNTSLAIDEIPGAGRGSRMS